MANPSVRPMNCIACWRLRGQSIGGQGRYLRALKGYDLHDGRCPVLNGGNCQCGLVSYFSNGRWIAGVDMFHSTQDIFPLH